MKNWAGNLEFYPEKLFAPKSDEDIMSVIKNAINENKCVRVRGSGHSWTGLIESKDYFIHLDDLQGVVEVNAEMKTIKVKSGTKLSLFGSEAHRFNLAMENQGDINKQTMAGATSTGTHGTGITLQSVANQIEALTLVNGLGEKVSIDRSSPYFEAARLSFGSLGVITDLTFKLRDAYKLKVETFAEDFDTSLNLFSDRLRNNRHLEMFYFPVGDWSLTKMMNESKEEPTHRGLGTALNEIVLENWLYTQLNRIASATGRYKLIDKIMRLFVSHEFKTDWSYRAFPTERSFKFMEMEYNIPIEKFELVINEMRASIKLNQFKTLFPIEIRFVKRDNLWLSPAFERDSVYFAVHKYITEDYRPYFEAMQLILQKHGGRPHWGKWHSMNAEKLKQAYPKFNDFLKVRAEFDPHGVFLNDHLKTIFGL
jgi:FAD-linked oxidoreductase